MNKTIKAAVITGSILICIGLIMVLAIGFTSDWKYTGVQWESKTYESDVDETITSLDLNFSAGKLNIEYYNGATVKVEYSDSKQLTNNFTVSNQTLKIVSTVHWHVQFLWFNNIPETTIYIPQGMRLGLTMRMEAGTFTVDKGIFNDVNIKMNAGTISASNLECHNFKAEMNAGTMKINRMSSDVFTAKVDAGSLNVRGLLSNDINLDISAGSAKIGVDGIKSEYNIKTSVSAGSCNVKNQNGTTLKTITVDVSAGSAKITFDE